MKDHKNGTETKWKLPQCLLCSSEVNLPKLEDYEYVRWPVMHKGCNEKLKLSKLQEDVPSKGRYSIK